MFRVDGPWDEASGHGHLSHTSNAVKQPSHLVGCKEGLAHLTVPSFALRILQQQVLQTQLSVRGKLMAIKRQLLQCQIQIDRELER